MCGAARARAPRTRRRARDARPRTRRRRRADGQPGRVLELLRGAPRSRAGLEARAGGALEPGRQLKAAGRLPSGMEEVNHVHRYGPRTWQAWCEATAHSLRGGGALTYRIGTRSPPPAVYGARNSSACTLCREAHWLLRIAAGAVRELVGGPISRLRRLSGPPGVVWAARGA